MSTDVVPGGVEAEMAADLYRYYELLERLARKNGEPRRLGKADGRMAWSRRGVYFFFETGEDRSGSGVGPRIVRIGTHGLKPGSASTLWGRLAQHRGSPAGGNHRGSVFRQLVGLAIAARDPGLAIPSWSQGSSATAEITDRERQLEVLVSDVIGAMRVAWVAIDDEPGADSLRGFVERNSIALLSSYRSPSPDPASPGWLGHYCPRSRIAKSGLWNSNHVDEEVHPEFFRVFEKLIEHGVTLAAPTRPALTKESKFSERVSPSGGNADKILAALQLWPDLDDDELSHRSGVVPRQQVNIICRRLEKQGVLRRFRGPNGKIVNQIIGVRPIKQFLTPRYQEQSSAPTVVPKSAIVSPISDWRLSVHSGDEDILVIIPCSGRKRDGDQPSGERRTLLDELPDALGQRLAAARRAIADVAKLNESTLMPAWRRNAGTLYQTAQLGIDNEQERKWFQNLLILNGGYGVVRAVDLIGSYNLAMVEKLWPRGLLQEVIEAFARKRKIRRVFAFASETTGYAAILGKVDWRRAGVEQAVLLSPETSTGAMVKAPRAIGEALRRVRSGGLETSWQSSDGYRCAGTTS